MSGTLAYNMRPQSLSDILGQEHIIGENGLFTKFVEKNHPMSVILYGPPGCGKTTFVMIQGIIGAFCVRIPVSYLMSKIEPVSLFKVGLATPTSTLVQIILCISFFIFLSKKTPKEDMNVDNLQEMQAL